MLRMSCSGSIASILLVLLTVPAAATDLMAVNGRVTLPIADEDPSLYFAIQNRGKKARRIVGGSCAGCDAVEIRRATLQDGVMVPQSLPEWEIPAGGSVAFAPRGLSIGLIGLTGLSEGAAVEVELEFADGEKVVLDAVVQQ
jgi:copper(I)-binding protein